MKQDEITKEVSENGEIQTLGLGALQDQEVGEEKVNQQRSDQKSGRKTRRGQSPANQIRKSL